MPPYRDHPDLKIVWLNQRGIDRAVFAANLSEIVQNNSRLVQDFPRLPKLYGDPQTALATLYERIDSIRECNGSYMAGVVLYGNTTRGMVTIDQVRFVPRVGWRRPVLGNGPWLAYWLDNRRPEGERYVGQALLRQMAAQIVRNSAFYGTPFTLVRADNHPSLAMLEDTGNGFHGFTKTGPTAPRQYLEHNITAPSWVMTARQSVQAMRPDN